VPEHKKVKSVCFNTQKENEKVMLKFVSRKNFSKYVKKLIQQDMLHKQSLKSQENTPPEPEPPTEKNPDEIRYSNTLKLYGSKRPD
jgi:hypothetical protein